jgi:hypothetical protein
MLIIKKIFFSIIILLASMIVYSIVRAMVRDLKGSSENGGFLFLLRIWPLVGGILLLLAFLGVVIFFSWKQVKTPDQKNVTDTKTQINP